MAKKHQPAPLKQPSSSSAPASAVRPGRFQWIAFVAVLAFTAILYLPSLRNGFTNWDDDAYVTANPDVVWQGEHLKTLATKEVAGNFHPLTMWTLAWDRGSNDKKAPDPEPFHRSGLLLHLLGTALVFWLALRLGAGWLAAAVTALFFGIHPLHVESVAWVSGRKDVLYTPLFVGGLIAFTYLREQARAGLWIAVVGLFVLSCLSKPAAIIFPLALWLVHWYQSPETALNPRRLGYLVPLLLVSAVFSYTTLKYQRHIGAVDEQYTFMQRGLFAAWSYLVYLVKMALPTGLAAFHPAPPANAALDWQFMAAPIGALGVLGLTAWAFFKQKNLFFALAFYLVNVMLVLGFIKVGSAVYAERYTYLSYTGLFLALGLLSERLIRQGGAAAWGMGAVLAAFTGFFAWQTTRQIPVWRDSETLWTQIVERYPQDEHCLSYRGYHRYLSQKWDKALEDFDRAYALNPNNETTVHIRAICLEKAGRTDDALKTYAEYEQKFPPNADELFQSANLLIAQKRFAEAAANYEKSLGLKPDNLDGWNNLANAWFNLKDNQKAEECFTKALDLKPDFLPGLNNRGAVRLTAGKYSEALEDFDKSLKMNPNQPQIVEYRKLAAGRGR